MSKLAPPSMSARTTTDAAAHWFMLLQETGASSQTFIEWQQWLNAAPENRAAYESIEDTVLRLGRVPAMPSLPTAEEMAADDYDGSRPIGEWKDAVRQAAAPLSTARARNDAGWHRYAIAASLALTVLAAGWVWLQHARPAQLGVSSYQTAAGEQREILLPDGSRVTLDADSALAVELTSGRRGLTLERGEAYFQVAKDARRPFVVQVGSAQVTAVGTAFNVRMSNNRTVVAVTEGKVEFVATPAMASASSTSAALADRAPASGTRTRLVAEVAAGEAVSYLDEGNLQALPPREAPLATAWLEGRRQYRNEPLRYVLADVDRYTGQRIELADAAAGELRFTGTLNLQNSSAWLRGLSVALPVTVEEKRDGSVFVGLKTSAQPAER